MNRCRLWLAVLCASMLCGHLLRAEEENSRPAIGQQVGPFTFKDIRYLPRSLEDLGKKRAYVLVLTTLDCPLVQRYLPVVKQLEEDLRGRDVQFLAVNVGINDPILEVAYQAVRVGAEFPFVKDFDGQVARAVGATRTPEAVVLDDQRRLRYRGRIDDQFRLGGARPAATRADLKTALEQVLAGEQVSVPETPVDGCLIQLAEPPLPEKPVTYAEHIGPLVQKHCQRCHHGGDSSFSLATYEEAVAHAATIAEVVREGRMPPWYGSREHGDFINRRSLAASEKRQVADWVRGGCALGDEAKLPKPVELDPHAWRIGKPDLVIQAAQVTRLPATGVMPYQYIMLPHVFLADTWIAKAEIRPSNPKAVHHCNMAFVGAGQKFNEANFITGQVPGGDALDLDSGLAFKIPALSLLALQVHYVPTGEETTDRLSVGLCFPRETVRQQLRHVQIVNRKFAIPPGAPHHEVTASRTLNCDATGVGMFTHMHVRGKDMVFRAFHPDGTKETLLAVPNYNFDWQMPYRWAAGARAISARDADRVRGPLRQLFVQPLQSRRHGHGPRGSADDRGDDVRILLLHRRRRGPEPARRRADGPSCPLEVHHGTSKIRLGDDRCGIAAFPWAIVGAGRRHPRPSAWLTWLLRSWIWCWSITSIRRPGNR